MPRSKEANQQIREAQREKILSAAWQVYTEKGRTLTITDIAEAAQVSYGLIYHYFASKEIILNALVEQTLASSEASFEHLKTTPGTPGERLASLLSHLVEMRHLHPEISQLYYQVLNDDGMPPNLRQMAAQHSQKFHDTLLDLVTAGQASGEVVAGDPQQLVTATLACLEGLSRLSITDPQQFRQHFPDSRIILQMLKPYQETRAQQNKPPNDKELFQVSSQPQPGKERKTMQRRGISYDVGRVMGVNWRPDFDPQVVHRELEIIKNDLHCNAVRICGYDIERLMIASRSALEQGLEVWLSPEIWDKSQAKTLAYMIRSATAAEKLHQEWPQKLVLCIGSELTLFMQGIIPGKNIIQRMRNPSFWENVRAGTHNQPLNAFLAEASAAVRQVFHGPLSYASLVWEAVDWSNFDFAGIDHYWSEKIKDQYLELLQPAMQHGKPVVITEFGFRTYRGDESSSALGLGNTDHLSLFLHQIPLLGHFIRPKLKRRLIRDEELQARELVRTLELLETAGVAGAFIMTFVSPISPYDENPRYDLDRDSFSLVKSFTGGRHGTTYPDMPWEPKKSFNAVAEYYAASTRSDKTAI